jgi:hypothetical protein
MRTQQSLDAYYRSQGWAKTVQRDDLLPCPFCGTKAIEQMRLANNATNMVFRISCGNPFCSVDCATPLHAGKHDAEEAWQDRK